MTRSKKNRGARPRPLPREKTTILVDESLQTALTRIVSGNHRQAVGALCEVLSRLRAEFDPSTVTMTSTNIPEALVKLSNVLTETNKASCRVFELVERQKRLISENSFITRELLKTAPSESGITGALARYQANSAELQSLANEIMLAHEFQDLCGQNINKVMKLISGLDSLLREFFLRMGCEIPPYSPAHASGEPVNQNETDDILRDFGL